jgi:Flp pilus assembly protein TadG
MLAPRRAIYRSCRGAALVELALVLVVLLLLVMGIMEFGLMFRNYLDVAQSVSAGCRSAALGSSTSVVNARITSTLSALGLNSAHSTSTVLQYRTYDKTTGVWTGWQTLGNATSGYNNAPSTTTLDSQIKITMVYTYPLATGAFLSPIIGNNGNVSLSGTCAMRREQTP